MTIEQLNAIFLYHEMILPKMLDAPWRAALTGDLEMGGVSVRPCAEDDFPPEAKNESAYMLEVTIIDAARTTALWRVGLPYPATMTFAEVCEALGGQCTEGIASLSAGGSWD